MKRITPILAAPSRKGSIRMADIPVSIRAGLNDGTLEAVTLVEILVIDFGKLFRAAAPDAGKEFFEAMDVAGKLTITARMRAAGKVLLDRYGLKEGLKRFSAHRSDTVRGWAANMIAADESMKFSDRLRRIMVFADDPNPGTREWAWMAVRGSIADHLEDAIPQLVPWTVSASPNLRRFATESTRPRGVWCTHIQALKKDPAIGLPLLEPLRSDSSKYVQDSVSNWLNDAAKSSPEFVRELCRDWLASSPTKETERICKRALRSL